MIQLPRVPKGIPKPVKGRREELDGGFRYQVARARRASWLSSSPTTLEAAETAGVRERADFRAALEAVFVKKREHAPVFDEAFRLFWRRRGYLEQLISMMAPSIRIWCLQSPRAR